MIGPMLALVRNEARRIWCFRGLVAVVTGLLCCVSAVCIRYLPNTYDAWAQIYVAPQTPLVSAAEGVSLVGSGYGNPSVALTTLLNDDNLEKIVRRIDPTAASMGQAGMAIAVAQLRGKIQRAPDPGEGFIELHVIDTDPVRARDVVRLLMDDFIASNIHRSQRDLSRAGAFLDEQITGYDAMLNKSQANITAFRDSHPEVARFELATAAGRFGSMAYAPSPAASQDGVVGPAPDAGPPPPSLAAQRVSELETKLAALLTGYTEKHPDVVATRRQLDEAIALRDSEVAATPPAGSAGSGAAPSVPRAQQASQSDPRLGARRAPVMAMPTQPVLPPDIAARWGELQKADELLRSNYQQLLAKKAATQMSQAVYEDDEAGKFQIVREPVVPVIPAGPNRPLYLLLAVVASIGAGLAAGYIRAAMKGVLVSAQELEHLLQLPVIGTVSWEPAWHTARAPQTRWERLALRLPRWLQPRRAP